jgi:hypothetical protein
VEKVGALRLRVVRADQDVLAVCNLMVRSGKHGFVLVVADEHGCVVVRKRYVKESGANALQEELDCWNRAHGDVLTARMVEWQGVKWMQMPYLHTLWRRSLDMDEILATACGCTLERVRDVVRELAREELRRVASRGVHNLDARLMNMGFCKENGRVRAAMIDFADSAVYPGPAEAEAFEAWQTQAADAMYECLLQHEPFYSARRKLHGGPLAVADVRQLV